MFTRRVSATVTIAVAMVLLSMGADAQEPQGQAAAAFEVVSIKLSGSSSHVMYGPGVFTPGGHGFRYSGTRVSCDQSLRNIIQEAFAIREPYRIIGPEWMNNQRYLIAAIMPAASTKENARLMLQAMLKDRLGLRYHTERKALPAYALVEARSGAKLRPANPTEASERVIQTPAGSRRGLSLVQEAGRFTAPAISVDGFANWLTNQMDAPVVNATDIKGDFDIDLRWEWDSAMGGRNEPALLGVIERQLGLKLEKRKVPLEVLVIEHVEKVPTGN